MEWVTICDSAKLCLLCLILLTLKACSSGPSPPLSPEEELATFELVPEYRIELVASEPMVQDPVAMTFDGYGRLWIVEMLGFMPDVDGNQENAPVGRVSVLMDLNSDGKMDSSVVFQDSLILPRAIAIVKGGVLVAEEIRLWFMEDLNNDLKADRRTLVDPEFGIEGVVEHSPNGLWRGLDNWYYNAKADFRYRLIHGQWIKDKTEFRGQWGICHDNVGRLYYNYNWSQLHADLVPPNYLSRNKNHVPSTGIDVPLSLDRQIFPIRKNLASNRGYLPGVLDEGGMLKEFTSACSPLVYRGQLFPADLVGDVFVCEPTANLIKHNKTSLNGAQVSATNAYTGREFLASTDERFRPVFLAEGPDGALYVADMYRGIIQHGLYMSPYLREITLKRKLDRPINLGRIWKIIPVDKDVSDNVSYNDAPSSELVGKLGHPGGWHRDQAQKLLVERQDKSVVPMLMDLIEGSSNYLTKIHAIWTLEGLNHRDPEIFFFALNDDNPHVRTMALRILEGIALEDVATHNQLEKYFLTFPVAEQTDLQVALTLGIFSTNESLALLADILTRYPESALFRDAALSSIEGREYDLLQMLLGRQDWNTHAASREIMIETLAAAIMENANSHELISLLNPLDIGDLTWQHRAILNGLAFQGVVHDSVKVSIPYQPKILKRQPDDSNSLSQLLAQLSSKLSWPGKIELVDRGVNQVSESIDPQLMGRGRQVYLASCASCHGNNGQGLNRFAPPLVNSEWVTGDEKRLILILLHGLTGPMTVNGKKYDYPEILPEMQAFASSSGRDLAAVMTYIRNAWGHHASAVEPRTVGSIRIQTQGKIEPWTEQELLQIHSNTEE